MRKLELAGRKESRGWVVGKMKKSDEQGEGREWRKYR